MEELKEFVQRIPDLLTSGSAVVIAVFSLVGLLFNYFGLKIYYLAVFLSGMVPGAILGGAVGFGAGWGEGSAVLAAIVCAFITGSLAVSMVQITFFALGAGAGALLLYAAGMSEPLVLIIAAIVCGIIALFLHKMAIITGTAATGSAMLTYAAVNAIAVMQDGRPEYLYGGISYLARLGREGLQGGGGQGIKQLLAVDFLLFIVFFASGIYVQYQLSAKGEKSGPASPDQNQGV